MSGNTMQINDLLSEREAMAVQVSRQWDVWYQQQAGKRAEWAELQKYLFATDTTSTSNSKLPWKNKTTMPKLTNLRDNLHSNYMSALFPNDEWLSWKAYSEDAAKMDVAKGMRAFMDNKLREGKFRNTASKLVYDWIDTGNCYAMPKYVNKSTERFGERITDFRGPTAVRISPYDICFDITAAEFKYTPKIIRSIKKMGDLAKEAKNEPGKEYWELFLEKRHQLSASMSGLKADDWEKVNQFEVDGFGSLAEYYGSHYVEILEFYGDWYNVETNELQENRLITVVDRSYVVQNVEIPTYDGSTPIFHCGWRNRPDNLIAMGPLDNLVGMQYRLDHLENLQADAMDLVVWPPLKIIGEVEEFQWGPGVPIHIDENGDVQELSTNITKLATAESKMQIIEDRMELYAGAPREAMGIRTPGEKTAFEVDFLGNAADSMRREKSVMFETELLEPTLNSMLEDAHRNFQGKEFAAIRDDETGIQEFVEITKDSFTSEGVLRPIGARHFAQQAQDLATLNQVFSGPMGERIAPHTSGIELTRLVDNTLNLQGYDLFRPNVAIEEAQETERNMQASQEQLEIEQEVPSDMQNKQAELPPEEEMEV